MTPIGQSPVGCLLQKNGFRFTRMHLLHTERLLVKRKPSRQFLMRDRAVERVSAVQFVPFINRARIGDRGGKSEVTAALRRYAVAATYLAEDIAEFRVSIIEEQRQALLSGMSEYVDGDEEVFRAYARLLKSTDSKAME